MFFSCKNKPAKINEETHQETVKVPDFNPDSAFAFVKAQTNFGPRVPNSTAHENCGLYLESKLTTYCDTVLIQKCQLKAYDGSILKSKNIIGIINPEKEKRVLLSAHWDSRHRADNDINSENWTKPIDGANDGASGVGVLLEIARQLQIKKPDIGIDIIFFDAEDYGEPQNERSEGSWWCLGSQYWAKKPHQSNYKAHYGILLDMVGDANAQFYMEGFSSQYAQSILSKVWGYAYQLGYNHIFKNNIANPIMDDHYYINTIAGIPTIDIIHQDLNSNTGFDPKWHTLNDNINHIDKTMLSIVGQVILGTIYNEK